MAGTSQDSPGFGRANNDAKVSHQLPRRDVRIDASSTCDSFGKVPQGLETLGAPAPRGLRYYRNEGDPLLDTLCFRAEFFYYSFFICRLAWTWPLSLGRVARFPRRDRTTMPDKTRDQRGTQGFSLVTFVLVVCQRSCQIQPSYLGGVGPQLPRRTA